MSFGFSVTDILTLVQLTSRTYNGWKNACGEYTRITGELGVLEMILVRVEAEAKSPTSLFKRDPEDLRHWDALSKECKAAVTELDDVLQKYKSLGTNRRKNWDRIRMSNRNFDELRRRLATSTAAISAFISVLGLSSQGRLENDVFPELLSRVDNLAAQMRAGKCSIRSSLTTYDDDDKEVWREFRRDLINSGFRSAAVRKYAAALKTYIGQLHRNGALDEEVPETFSSNTPAIAPPSSSDVDDTGCLGASQDESEVRRGQNPEESSNAHHGTEHVRPRPQTSEIPYMSPYVEDDLEADDEPKENDVTWQNAEQVTNDLMHDPEDNHDCAKSGVQSPVPIVDQPERPSAGKAERRRRKRRDRKNGSPPDIPFPPQPPAPPPSPSQSPLEWQKLPTSQLHPIKEKPVLPEGWDWRIDDQNRLFYVDTYARGTEKRCFWEPPKEEVELDEVPGWDRICTLFGRVFWVHRQSKLTSYEHPRESKHFMTDAYDQIWLRRKHGGFSYLIKTGLKGFKLNDEGVSCQIARSVWQNGLSDEAVEKRGALWWGNPGVIIRHIRSTPFKPSNGPILE